MNSTKNELEFWLERIDDDDGDIRYEIIGSRNTINPEDGVLVTIKGENAKVYAEKCLQAMTTPDSDRHNNLKYLEQELCGDEVNGGFIRNLCYTVWHKCHYPTHEDGNTDWFDDTLPTVQKAVKIIREKINKLGE